MVAPDLVYSPQNPTPNAGVIPFPVPGWSKSLLGEDNVTQRSVSYPEEPKNESS